MDDSESECDIYRISIGDSEPSGDTIEVRHRIDQSEWFDTQWDKVEGFSDPSQEYDRTFIPKSRLGEQRWTPEQTGARGQELLSFDFEKLLAKSDLAPLYQHVHDVGEALQQITDDWPVRVVELHGERMHATVLPKQYQEPLHYKEKRPLDAFWGPVSRYYGDYYGYSEDGEGSGEDYDSDREEEDDDEEDEVEDDEEDDDEDDDENANKAGGKQKPDDKGPSDKRGDYPAADVVYVGKGNTTKTGVRSGKVEQFYTDEEFLSLHVDLGKQLLQRFNQIRAAIEERSRPHLRLLSLGDMPAEIINRIFDLCGLLKGEEPDSDRYECGMVFQHDLPLDLVKSIRLTCRSLCEIISPALFRVRSLRPTPESLDRLDYISRHPLFSKGVRQIHMSASYYDGNVARDPALFVLYAIRRFTSNCAVLSDGYNSDEYEDYTFSEEEEMAYRAYDSTSYDFDFMRPKRKKGRTPKKNDLRRIVGGWRKLIAPIRYQNGVPTTSTAEGTEWRSSFEQEKILSQAYDVYRRKYADQEAALSRFPQVVSEAMARMPGIYYLDVCDHGYDTSTNEPDYNGNTASRKAMLDLITGPHSWSYFQGDDHFRSENPVASMVGKLLPTLGSHGCKLKYLVLSFTPPRDLNCFRMTESEKNNVAQAMHDIQHFSFGIVYDYMAREKGPFLWPPRSAEQLAALDGFVDCLLSSDSLKAFDLDFEALRCENARSSGSWYLPSLMKARPWPNLRKIRLKSVCLSSLELDGFLRKGPLLIAEMKQIHMARGTWAQALDIMREKYDPDWKHKHSWMTVDDGLKGLSVHGSIWEASKWESASGAECATMRARGVYERTFEAGVPTGEYYSLDRDGYGQAQKYISHQQDQNPCRMYE